jgi:serine/threonine-protein kinase
MNPRDRNHPTILAERYQVHGEIASGGMATVHYARLIGNAGFARTVAIKRMHAHCAKDPDFASMFLDEARLAARIRHPNVVPVLDVVASDGELFLVMEYVQGETLSRLVRASVREGQPIPVRIACSIVAGTLEGLHAAHEAVSETGQPLGIVHRDVSPQNILVGADGVARVLDFGIAKATIRTQSTRDGQIKGKLPYMAPEQLRGALVDRRTDVYSASVVLWEALAGRRLWEADNEAALMGRILGEEVHPPSELARSVPHVLDGVVLKGLARDSAVRFQSAQEMAIAIERAVSLAAPREVGRWVEALATGNLKEKADRIAEIESSSLSLDPLAQQGDSQRGVVPSASPSMASGVTAPTTADVPAQWNSLSQPRSSHAWIAALIVAATLCGGAVVLAAFVLRSGRPTAELQAPAQPLPTPTGSSTAASLVAAPTVQASSSTPVAPPSAPAPTVAVVERRKPPSESTPVKARKKSDCNPPYVLDGEGIRHMKPECL